MEGDDLVGMRGGGLEQAVEEAVIVRVCPPHHTDPPFQSASFHSVVLPLPLSISTCRRDAILKAHPEIRKLFGPCPWTKYKAAAIITTQV
jgi:hypothetical protein